MSLEEMLLRSELKRERLVPGEMDRLLETVHRRLQDASHPEIYPETRLEQAYHAILGCALIALRAHGLRLTGMRGHHIVALESLLDKLSFASRAY